MSERKLHAPNSCCALARALDIVGDHWTMLILRDLGLRGCHEYKELLASPEGISTNILSDRLKKLEQGDLVGSMPHPTHGRRKLYYLKQKGKDLLPVVLQLFLWGDAWVEGADMPDRLRSALGKGIDATMDRLHERMEAWEQEFGMTIS